MLSNLESPRTLHTSRYLSDSDHRLSWWLDCSLSFVPVWAKWSWFGSMVRRMIGTPQMHFWQHWTCELGANSTLMNRNQPYWSNTTRFSLHSSLKGWLRQSLSLRHEISPARVCFVAGPSHYMDYIGTMLIYAMGIPMLDIRYPGDTSTFQTKIAWQTELLLLPSVITGMSYLSFFFIGIFLLIDCVRYRNARLYHPLQVEWENTSSIIASTFPRWQCIREVWD